MQPCNRIYYSTVHWRLNMFRAAYRSSSGAQTVYAASGLHTHVVTGHSQVWVGTAVPTQTHVEPSMNGGIVNSITRLHLVGYFYWVILRCTDPWILNSLFSEVFVHLQVTFICLWKMTVGAGIFKWRWEGNAV